MLASVAIDVDASCGAARAIARHASDHDIWTDLAAAGRLRPRQERLLHAASCANGTAVSRAEVAMRASRTSLIADRVHRTGRGKRVRGQAIATLCEARGERMPFERRHRIRTRSEPLTRIGARRARHADLPFGLAVVALERLVAVRPVGEGLEVAEAGTHVEVIRMKTIEGPAHVDGPAADARRAPTSRR